MSVRILAIETATNACSAALIVDDDVQEQYVLEPRRHAALILPMIESLLAESGIKVAGLDAIAMGRGPGSFTGVRIAASVAQGIACAADLPVVPVSTLAALALGGMRETGASNVMAALDARKAEVYWGCFLQSGNSAVLLQGEECVCAPDSVPLPGGNHWVGVGSGWAAEGRHLRDFVGKQVTRVMPDLEPRAADVARLALHDYRRGLAVDPEHAVPVYLRNNVAEVKKPRIRER